MKIIKNEVQKKRQSHKVREVSPGWAEKSQWWKRFVEELGLSRE